MALNFRRRVKLAKGVHLDISKGGTSISLGGPGATMNLNTSGIRTTVGAPGAGVSDSHSIPGAAPMPRTPNISNAQLVSALRAMAQVQDPSLTNDDPIVVTVTLPPVRPGAEITQPVVRPEPQGGGFLFFILVVLPVIILWIRALR